jgi:hypothetical protein
MQKHHSISTREEEYLDFKNNSKNEKRFKMFDPKLHVGDQRKKDNMMSTKSTCFESSFF